MPADSSSHAQHALELKPLQGPRCLLAWLLPRVFPATFLQPQMFNALNTLQLKSCADLWLVPAPAGVQRAQHPGRALFRAAAACPSGSHLCVCPPHPPALFRSCSTLSTPTLELKVLQTRFPLSTRQVFNALNTLELKSLEEPRYLLEQFAAHPLACLTLASFVASNTGDTARRLIKASSLLLQVPIV